MLTSWLTNILVLTLATAQPSEKSAGAADKKAPVHSVAKAEPAPADGEPSPVAATVPTRTLSLDEIVARVQAHYDQTRSYRARFEQAQLNATFGRTRKSSGEVMFKKPGFMRWNYQKPESKVFVSDGNVLWLYEPADNQAFKQDLTDSQLPAALAFLMGKGKMKEEFDVAFADSLNYGRPQDYRLSLKPRKTQAQYKSIYFIVDPDSFQVRQTILVDAQGNINDISFTDVTTNPKLADAIFKWKPPAGVRVVTPGQMGALPAR